MKFNKTRPISWSSYSSFLYDKEAWYRRYYLNEKVEESPEMAFGKVLATSLENGTCTIPLLNQHLINNKEHPFNVKFCGIPLIGYADDFCVKTFKQLNEVKTGKKEWNQKRVNEHRQFDMYLLMNFITNKIKPEDVWCRLFWLPTQDTHDFGIELIDPNIVHIFETKRTMADILNFGKELKEVYGKMEEFVENHK